MLKLFFSKAKLLTPHLQKLNMLKLNLLKLHLLKLHVSSLLVMVLLEHFVKEFTLVVCGLFCMCHTFAFTCVA